jgi:hypothetical protein
VTNFCWHLINCVLVTTWAWLKSYHGKCRTNQWSFHTLFAGVEIIRVATWLPVHMESTCVGNIESVAGVTFQQTLRYSLRAGPVRSVTFWFIVWLFVLFKFFVYIVFIYFIIRYFNYNIFILLFIYFFNKINGPTWFVKSQK